MISLRLVYHRSRAICLTFTLSSITICLAPRVQATVQSSPIVALPEANGPFYWGDGTHVLFQEWSIAQVESSGWFYGSNYSWSNADVYVYPGLSDPTTVAHAELFPYTCAYVRASEGDTVFFRGTNGAYGAWRIDAIYTLPGGPPYAALDGQWYFQDNETGCFSAECGSTPVQSSTWGRVKALYGR